MSINRVFFYNYWHRGDLHYSRSFVKKIVGICAVSGIKCYYCYNDTDYNILADIEPMENIGMEAGCDNGADKIIGDALYLNTWYGSKPDIFNVEKTSFRCLYRLFSIYFKHFGLNISDVGSPIDFFPSIDYSKYYIQNVKKFMEENANKRMILISNGPALSAQSNNAIDYEEIIRSLANKFYGVIFILTDNKKNIQMNNVFYAGDIIGKEKGRCDLNEISYLGTCCESIIGKSSGPYSFSMTKENMFNYEKTFLCFCVNDNIYYNNLAYWKEPNDTLLPPYKCRIIQQVPHSNDSVYSAIEDIIAYPSR